MFMDRISSVPADAPSSPEDALGRTREVLRPGKGVQEAIKQRIAARIEAPVGLLPGPGEGSVLIGGPWQPVTGEVRLNKSALIQTGADGFATLIVHDDGVVRLGSGTTLAIHDLSDRPAKPQYPKTFTLD